MESLFSTSWYRVAELRPRLRSHALIHRHLYRGQIWYVLQDSSSGRFHRFSPIANVVIGLMDGQRTLREIWELACERLGDDAPTQDEVIGILSSLHRADVLRSDVRPDMQELHERHVKQERMKLKQYIQNPLSLRFPLFDPDRLLNWMNHLSRHFFGPFGALLFLCAAAWATLTVGQNWAELSGDVTDHLFATENLFLIALVFPFAKIVHEFGHALAIKARGGEVHEMGVMLLVLMPIPYLDASSSLAFREKRDRMLVGSAGMLSELCLAALALLVWVSVEPGLVRALAYNVMLVAGVSTLVFNINPLLRFDGYYIFSDFLEIPNLGQRANAYFTYLVKHHLLRLKSALAGHDTQSERSWFVFYAIASFAYRITLTFSIALMVAQKYFIFGILLAIWSLYNSLILPLAKQFQFLFSSRDLRGQRAQALGTVGGILILAGVFVFQVPVPSWSRTEGVAFAPESSQVRAATDGFITSVVAQPNQTVAPGQTLLVMEDLELGARRNILQAQVNEQQARYTAAFDEPVQRNIIRDELQHLQARLQDSTKRMGELVVRSPAQGIFLISDAGDLPGRFVRRGELLGYVIDYSRITVQVVVAQDDIDLVRKMTRRVELRSVENIPDLLVATVKRVVPGATNQLPGEALGARGGGTLALDPSANSGAGHNPQTTAAASVFVFELELDDRKALPLRHIGSRIYARFEREPEPIGTQAYRAARRVFLSLFNV